MSGKHHDAATVGCAEHHQKVRVATETTDSTNLKLTVAGTGCTRVYIYGMASSKRPFLTDQEAFFQKASVVNSLAKAQATIELSVFKTLSVTVTPYSCDSSGLCHKCINLIWAT